MTVKNQLQAFDIQAETEIMELVLRTQRMAKQRIMVK